MQAFCLALLALTTLLLSALLVWRAFVRVLCHNYTSSDKSPWQTIRGESNARNRTDRDIVCHFEMPSYLYVFLPHVSVLNEKAFWFYKLRVYHKLLIFSLFHVSFVDSLYTFNAFSSACFSLYLFINSFTYFYYVALRNSNVNAQKKSCHGTIFSNVTDYLKQRRFLFRSYHYPHRYILERHQKKTR